MSRLEHVVRVGATVREERALCKPCAPTGRVFENLAYARFGTTKRLSNWETCPICLYALSEPPPATPPAPPPGPEIVVLERSCNHVFHVACLSPWATNNSGCPICRVPFHPVDIRQLFGLPPPTPNEELLSAAEEGSLDRVRDAISRGASLAAQRPQTTETPLILASDHGHREIVRHILHMLQVDPTYSSNPNDILNAGTNDGMTAVHVASSRGHIGIVGDLLAAGANVNPVTVRVNSTPLYLASYSGHVLTIETLLAFGANIQIADRNGTTPLMTAAYSGHVEVVLLLLSRDIKRIDDGNNVGTTALMFASEQGHLGVVANLLVKGADPKAADKDNWTALMLASLHGRLEVVQKLLPFSNVNVANIRGGTALMHGSGAARNALPIVQALLAAGANPNARSITGKTALWWATHPPDLTQAEVVDALRAGGATDWGP